MRVLVLYCTVVLLAILLLGCNTHITSYRILYLLDECPKVTQIVRGVVAVPESIIAPKQGKWWNESTHQWVYTDLTKVEVPENDDDLLHTLESELDAEATAPTASGEGGSVKETYYYDVLEVSIFFVQSILRAMAFYVWLSFVPPPPKLFAHNILYILIVLFLFLLLLL